MSSEQNPNSRLQPDLDEEINVAETHAVFKGATAATIRERRLHENGMEPVPLWLFLLAGIALLVGGVVLGKGGTLFSYSSETMWANQWKEDESVVAGPPSEGPALDFFVKQGLKTYKGKCNGCHQPDGKGDGQNFPPLAGSEWVSGEGTEALAMIILNGLEGSIEVSGRTWNQVMPAQGPLPAKELAAVMTYIRNEFNGVGDVVSVEQAQAAVDAYDARGAGKAVTSAELKAGHMKPLSGALMAPDTVIDFETYQPVGNTGGN